MEPKSPEIMPLEEEDSTLCAYLSEKALKKDWQSQEEDEAWKTL
jgi:hypothetical protein